MATLELPLEEAHPVEPLGSQLLGSFEPGLEDASPHAR
jgi:hypothetical protein